MKKLNNKVIKLDDLAEELLIKVNKSEFTYVAVKEASVVYTLAEFLAAKSRNEKLEILRKFANNVLELFRVDDPDYYDENKEYSVNDIKIPTTKYTEMPTLNKTFVNRWLKVMDITDDDTPFKYISDLFVLAKKAESTNENDAIIIASFRNILDFVDGLIISKVRKTIKKFQLEPDRFLFNTSGKCYSVNL